MFQNAFKIKIGDGGGGGCGEGGEGDTNEISKLTGTIPSTSQFSTFMELYPAWQETNNLS